MNLLRRVMPENRINKGLVGKGIMVFTVMLSWGAIVLNAPVLSFTSICSPIFGMVGCLIPACCSASRPSWRSTDRFPLIDRGSPSGGPFSIGAADGAPAR